MQSTTFGHIILGRFNVKNNIVNAFPILSITNKNSNENDQILQALNKFWQIEEVNENKNELLLTDEEKLVENHFVETYYREASGRYVVKIPIHPECKGLGQSRNLAFRQFMQLEKRLEKKPELREKYVQYMREYISAGFMKPARETYDPKFAYWLPHHPVEKKFRVVVNASAKTSSGESLNCIQMTGGKLQHDLAIQIMRFGKYRNRQRMQTARRQCEGAQAIDFARQRTVIQ